MGFRSTAMTGPFLVASLVASMSRGRAATWRKLLILLVAGGTMRQDKGPLESGPLFRFFNVLYGLFLQD